MAEVGEDGAGQRLDNYLLKRLKGAPQSLIYRIIRSGEVRVNKGRVQAASKIALGDVVPGLDSLSCLRVNKGALNAEVGKRARVHHPARNDDFVSVATG